MQKYQLSKTNNKLSKSSFLGVNVGGGGGVGIEGGREARVEVEEI